MGLTHCNDDKNLSYSDCWFAGGTQNMNIKNFWNKQTELQKTYLRSSFAMFLFAAGVSFYPSSEDGLSMFNIFRPIFGAYADSALFALIGCICLIIYILNRKN